jgi:DNA-binding transcriptional LysR family regulator
MRGTEFAELTAFVAVAEQRSFAKAAAQLGIAPSTLSQTIRTLEERLGVRLLNRTTRSVAPTEAGERLVAQLQPAFEGVAHAVETINDFRDKPMGTLRLLMGRPIAMGAIAPLIAPFLAAYPEITLDIVSDDTRQDIVSGRFDAGLRIGERIERDMIAVRIIDEIHTYCVASPSYPKAGDLPKTPKDLRTHDCIRLRSPWDGVVHAWEFDRKGEKVDIDVHGRLIVNDAYVALQAALAGAGIAYLPRNMTAPYLADGRLIPILAAWCVAVSGVYIYYPSRRQIPATLQAFINFARKLSAA